MQTLVRHDTSPRTTTRKQHRRPKAGPRQAPFRSALYFGSFPLPGQPFQECARWRGTVTVGSTPRPLTLCTWYVRTVRRGCPGFQCRGSLLFIHVWWLARPEQGTQPHIRRFFLGVVCTAAVCMEMGFLCLPTPCTLPGISCRDPALCLNLACASNVCLARVGGWWGAGGLARLGLVCGGGVFATVFPAQQKGKPQAHSSRPAARSTTQPTPPPFRK